MILKYIMEEEKECVGCAKICILSETYLCHRYYPNLNHNGIKNVPPQRSRSLGFVSWP